MVLLQTIVGLACLFAMSRVWLRYKDGKLSGNEALFWIGIFTAVIAVAVNPTLTTPLSDLFGVGRGIDFALYAGITLLFYLLFRIYVKLETLEQDFTKAVRELAFMKAKENGPRHPKSNR